jgi:hypothetical protein
LKRSIERSQWSKYFRHQSLSYRPHWVEEKYGGRLQEDVKAGKD